MRRVLCGVATAACLVACAFAVEEDDEVVIVEDVKEDFEPTRIRDDKPKQHKSQRKRESAYEKRRKRETEAKQLTPAECFEKARAHLGNIRNAVDRFEDYVDGGVVAKIGEDLDGGVMELFKYHHATVKKDHKVNAAANQQLFDEAEEIDAERKALLEAVDAQVDAHQALLRSAREIIPETDKHKALVKYVDGRLRAGAKGGKKLEKKLSSLDNIKELLRLQKTMRHGRWLGLSAAEATRFIALATVPWFVQAAMRAAVGYGLKVPNYIPVAVDYVISAAVPMYGAHLATDAVGLEFLSPKNLMVIAAITVSMWTCLLMLTETGLRPLLAHAGAKRGRRVPKAVREAREAKDSAHAQDAGKDTKEE